MRNADPLGDRAGVVDVLPGAAGALAMGGGAVVVELQRDADDVVAFGLQQRRRHRRIDAAGHRDDDTGVLRPAGQIEAVEHCASIGIDFPCRNILQWPAVLAGRQPPLSVGYIGAPRLRV